MTTATKTKTTTWTIDSAHTDAAFAVRHLMISTVRGRFGSVSGSVAVDEDDPRDSKIDVNIDVASLDTRQDQRDAHLRSADFFDAERFPAIRFVSTKIDGDVTDKFRVTGNLTIRDVTRPITLEVTSEGNTKDPWGNERAGFSASGKLNREDFGLLWNQTLEAGGVLVGSEVKLSIDVELIRKPE